MKIKQTLKFLTFSAASLLALQAANALPVIPPKNWNWLPAGPQAWQDLQDKMASLSATSAPEDLLAAEANVVTYQSVLAQTSDTGWNNNVSGAALQGVIELINIDASNPISLVQTSIDFGNFEHALLQTRVGLVNSGDAIDAKFDQNTESLFNDVLSDLIAWQSDLQNVDHTNPAAVLQVNLEGKIYRQDLKKLHAKIDHDKKLSLQDAVNAAALTPDEQQLWNQFQSTLAEKCKAACKNYCATATFPDNENVDLTNPAAVLEAKLYRKEEIAAHIGAFKLLEQGCRYEFLNVLLTKRTDADSSLNSFHQLQSKLDQFLNNIDVNSPIAALQAQVDMLAYERGVAAAPVTLAPTPAVK